MAAFYGKHSDDHVGSLNSGFDDSIEEMASMLLDNTTMNELTGEPGKRLSQLGSAQILPHIPRGTYTPDKPSPQLPQLLFNGNDVWAAMSSPVMTAAGNKNVTDFMSDADELDSCPPPVSKEPAHMRKSSAPPLPRKSSKRKPRQPSQKEDIPNQIHKDENKRQNEPRKLSKMMQQDPGTPPTETRNEMASISPIDVNQKIEAMLKASRDLKPMDGGFANESTAIKKGIKENKVLQRMKNAINERINDKDWKKRHGSATNTHLLDLDLSQLSDFEEVSTVSAIDRRINEGRYPIYPPYTNMQMYLYYVASSRERKS